MPTEHSWPTRGLNEHVFQLLPVLADNVRKSEFVAWVHGHEEQPRSRAFVLQTVRFLPRFSTISQCTDEVDVCVQLGRVTRQRLLLITMRR